MIEKSKSPRSASLVLVVKEDASKRLCIDYRDLNKVTKKAAYSTKNCDYVLDKLRKARYKSKVDLKYIESTSITGFDSFDYGLFLIQTVL